MAKFDTTTKAQKRKIFSPPRAGLLAVGIAFIVVSVAILAMSLYEAFWNGGKFHLIQLPGFHELKLETAGLYAGVYQHRGAGPLPLKALTQMEVRVMSKDNYEEVPVLMNSTGQTFERFGLRGLPLFNFVIQNPGIYTLSGVYVGDVKGPDIAVLLFPQALQNVKQTLFVGASFFTLFLVLGIFVLVKLNRWTPLPQTPKPVPPKKT